MKLTARGQDADYPGVVPLSKGRELFDRELTQEEGSVRGTLVKGLTAEDMKYLDNFEGDVSVIQTVLSSRYRPYVTWKHDRNISEDLYRRTHWARSSTYRRTRLTRIIFCRWSLHPCKMILRRQSRLKRTYTATIRCWMRTCGRLKNLSRLTRGNGTVEQDKFDLVPSFQGLAFFICLSFRVGGQGSIHILKYPLDIEVTVQNNTDSILKTSKIARCYTPIKLQAPRMGPEKFQNVVGCHHAAVTITDAGRVSA